MEKGAQAPPGGDEGETRRGAEGAICRKAIRRRLERSAECTERALLLYSGGAGSALTVMFRRSVMYR